MALDCGGQTSPVRSCREPRQETRAQFPLFRRLAGRTVTTLHGRQDLPDLRPLYFGFNEMPLVSISDAQRAPIPNANFVAAVYHGLPLDLHRPTFNPRGESCRRPAGRNLMIEFRWANGDYDRLPQLTAELISRSVAAGPAQR